MPWDLSSSGSPPPPPPAAAATPSAPTATSAAATSTAFERVTARSRTAAAVYASILLSLSPRCS
ncbi:MAG TPA: hypothetical protein VG722_13405, partial [Tepidisphaeraceae bacterium]|nr:hypothetical protein [Tepidisphaeraceae bacterium]